jgi:hypothetical protein
VKSTRVRRIVCDVGSETDGVFSAGTKAKLSIYIYLHVLRILLFSQINKT